MNSHQRRIARRKNARDQAVYVCLGDGRFKTTRDLKYEIKNVDTSPFKAGDLVYLDPNAIFRSVNRNQRNK